MLRPQELLAGCAGRAGRGASTGSGAALGGASTHKPMALHCSTSTCTIMSESDQITAPCSVLGRPGQISQGGIMMSSILVPSRNFEAMNGVRRPHFMGEGQLMMNPSSQHLMTQMESDDIDIDCLPAVQPYQGAEQLRRGRPQMVTISTGLAASKRLDSHHDRACKALTSWRSLTGQAHARKISPESLQSTTLHLCGPGSLHS